MAMANKKKHVLQELTSSCDGRLPESNERFVRVLSGQGSNLYEVEEIGKEGETFFVYMPGKFRKTVWVKRGDILTVADMPDVDKAKAEITEVLTKKRIIWLKKMKVWPVSTDSGLSSDEEEFINTNRQAPSFHESSSSSELED